LLLVKGTVQRLGAKEPDLMLRGQQVI